MISRGICKGNEFWTKVIVIEELLSSLVECSQFG